ncbi:MAG: hypothetical protein ACPHF0_03105, partial [Poseidonia sp.]
LDLRKISPKLAAGGSLASRRSLRGDQLFQKLNEVKGTYLRAVQAGSTSTPSQRLFSRRALVSRLAMNSASASFFIMFDVGREE